MEKPLEKQIGGNHYKNFAIQPVEFSTKNNLGFLQGCIIKRICRYNQPGGKGLQDLKKIIHEVELLIDLDRSLQDDEGLFFNEDFPTKIVEGTTDLSPLWKRWSKNEE